MKIVKSLEDSGLLMEDVDQAIQNETKEQKDGFLGILLGTLGASLLGNMLAVKRTKGRKRSETQAHIPGKGIIRAGDGFIRAGEGTANPKWLGTITAG